MSFVQSIEGCMGAAIGAAGLSPGALDDRLKFLEPAVARLRDHYERGTLALLQVPGQSEDIEDAALALARLSEGAKTLIFFGTGGSSLGGQAIAQLGGWFIPGQQRTDQMRRPRTRFYDNLDPQTLEASLSNLDFERTRFVVISKSGNTGETLVQFLTALQAVKEAGYEKRVPEFFLALSDPAALGVENGLRNICEAHGIPLLDHNPDIGGRFASLTNVGMLPALARGLDGTALRAGARRVICDLIEHTDIGAFAPAAGAAVSIGLAEECGAHVQVMMPYTDRLGHFADWYVQLVAESLGKGGKGLTPVAAMGPVDQHSKLQLYLDGPRDHMITVLRTKCEGTGPIVDAALATQAGTDYLAGHSAGDFVAAQQAAIPKALVDAGRPVRTIDLERLDEGALGGLMMHFMLETILSAHLLDVDPFDQPAVEVGKSLTRRHLGGRE